MGVYLPGGLATQGPCPTGFHIPENSEFSTVGTIISNRGLDVSSIKTYLKIPDMGGIDQWTGSQSVGNAFGFWSSTRDFTYTYNAYLAWFYSSGYNFTNTSYISLGYPIRPFKDVSVTPDSSWTTLYQGSGNAGIYHNSTLGLISLSSDGTDRITIADKNLGATTVYNSGDTLSQANCGNYYQRGNNYGFPFTGTVTTSSSQVNAGSYGPGNYYSSSTFVITTGSSTNVWEISGNQNLRGGVDGNVQVQKELKNAYIGEVYEYSYDFRNKSVSQVQNDGWTFQEGSGNVAFNANGVYLSNKNYNLRMWNVKGPWTNANKITMTMTATVGAGSATFKLSTSDNADANSTAINIDSNGNKQVLAIYGTSYTFSGLSSGTYTQKAVLDLVNKTYTLSCTGKTDNTGSITDAQIAGIKANSKTVGVYIWQSSTGTVIRDISILVE